MPTTEVGSAVGEGWSGGEPVGVLDYTRRWSVKRSWVLIPNLILAATLAASPAVALAGVGQAESRDPVAAGKAAWAASRPSHDAVGEPTTEFLGLVPMMSVPDTRQLRGLFMDVPTIASIVRRFQSHLPNEHAVCLYGRSEADTVLWVTDAPDAAIAFAAPDSVVFSPGVPSGCADAPNLIAAAHAHLIGSGEACEFSQRDRQSFGADTRMLADVVMCTDGRGVLLMRDTREFRFWWLRRPQAGEGRPLAPESGTIKS